MENESSTPKIRVEGHGSLELKSIRLDEEVPMPTPNEPHYSDHKKETDQIPIGEFTAIKDRTPPTMAEQ
jgi:hypothetical protein